MKVILFILRHLSTQTNFNSLLAKRKYIKKKVQKTVKNQRKV